MTCFKLIALRPIIPQTDWTDPASIPNTLKLCTPKVAALISAARSKNTSFYTPFDIDAHFWSETNLESPSPKCSSQEKRFQYLISKKFKTDQVEEFKGVLNDIDMISGVLFLPVSDEITGVDIAIAALCGIWLVGTPNENVEAHGHSLTPPQFMSHDIFHFEISSRYIDYSGQAYSDFSRVFLRNLEYNLTDSTAKGVIPSYDAKHVLAAFFVCFHEKMMFSLDQIWAAKDSFRDQKQFKGTEAESLVKELGLKCGVPDAMTEIFEKFESFMKEAFGVFSPVIQDLPGMEAS